MSYADQVFRANCLDILQNGVRDDDLTVRPHWEDGTPAHTIKKFGLVNRYDLQKEFPILTLRRTYLKSAVDELLWIWQKKSNNVHDLSSHIWDAWADETGSIGKAYGYQLGVKHQYKEGMFDQVDRVLYDLRHNPASRRILTSLYNVHQQTLLNRTTVVHQKILGQFFTAQIGISRTVFHFQPFRFILINLQAAKILSDIISS